MDSHPLLQTAAGGLMGCQLWTAPLEGAFTMVAKIALINALEPRALCDLLFGRKLLQASFAEIHGRSLLHGIWIAPNALSTSARAVVSGLLSSRCGGWATVVASDARLRLCPTCADVGYQSALFQIDALSACPIHGEPLVDACTACGAPTPRYALTSEAFESPMRCPVCGTGYGRAWNGTANFAGWTGPSDTRSLQRLARNLEALPLSEVAWPDVSAWSTDPNPDRSPRRRAAIFHALMTLTGAQQDDAEIVVRADSCDSGDRRWHDERPRVAIFKSIWRHVVKRSGLARFKQRFNFDKTFYLHRVNEAIVPKCSDCPPILHAFTLWTKRCEVGDSHRLSRWRGERFAAGVRSVLELHTRVLRWPSDVWVTDRLWGHFIWSCFLEDLWTAQQWQEATVPLRDPLERGDARDPNVQANRARYMEQLAVWMPRMSPLLEFFPSGLSHFTWRQGGEGQRLSLVTPRRHEGDVHELA